jgi:hypothetical protein
VDNIVNPDFHNFIPDKNLSGATNDRDQVSMLVTLECRMSVDADLEVTQLNCQVVSAVKERLARDALKNRPIFLVGMDIDILPSVIAILVPNHCHLDRHANCAHVIEGQTSRL